MRPRDALREARVQTDKAVILARGLGKRMRKADGVGLKPDAERMAEQGLKGMIPIGGRPFLDWVVGSLLKAGLRKICLVIAPDADLLRAYAKRTSELTGADIACAVQEEPLGTADAVLAAEGFVGAESFVMCNCDNLYPHRALAALASACESGCWVVAFDRDEMLRKSNFAVERVRAFSVVLSTPDGRLRDIIEKPQNPERYAQDGRLWVNMNLYRFTPAIFDACRRIHPHPERKELELTAAVSLLAREGRTPFNVIHEEGGVLDLTSRGDVARVEELLSGRSPGF
jgi:dTDP-glucose pyrophosphorylase